MRTRERYQRARTGRQSPSGRASTFAAAARREVVVRTSARLAERALRRAARTGEPVLLGPWLGEIGYELEYWIPFARRELRLHGVEPERVTVLTRGGAALWYRDFAAHALDALELVSADRFLPLLEERRALAGDAKQLLVERFDRELVALARERLGPVTVIHPSLMFARLRGLWFKGTPLAKQLLRLDVRPLQVEPLPGLPQEYVAVKAYFNECLPETQPNERFLSSVLERLASATDVVLLSTGLLVDDHEEWAARRERVHSIEHLLRPEDNLAVQTRIIAGSRGLVATYGGFSYLGALLGVPTLTFYELEQTVPIHLDVLHAALPDAAYERVRAGDVGAVEKFAAAAAES
jgi:hypothetical protein